MVANGTYHQVWWPAHDEPRYVWSRLPEWVNGVGYLDPTTRRVLPTWDEALDRAATGFRAVVDRQGPTAFGLFSCSKSTNEMNYAAGKFARVALGSNNIDSCNRT